MKSREFAIAACCAWLATAAMAHDAAPAAHVSHTAPRLAVLTGGSTTLDAAQQLELFALPAKELRQRVDKVLAAHPDDLVARLLRAQAECELGDFAATLVDLEPVIPALAPGGKAAAYSLRSEALIQLRRNDEALADAERAVADDPTDPLARFARGWALHLARQDDKQAMRDIELGLAKEPDDAVGLARRGLLHLALDEPALAEVDLRRASDLAPDDTGIRVELAGALLVQGQVEAGRRQIEAAIRRAPDDAAAWSMRAQLALSKGDADAAIADATHALQLQGDFAVQSDAYDCRATAWASKGDYAKMLADLDKGMAIDPTRADFLLIRGTYETQVDQPETAKATLTKALALDPRCAGCLAQRAVALSQLGDRDGALADARAARAMEPHDASLRAVVGNAFAALGDFAEALPQFDAALKITPANDLFRMERGAARDAAGDHAGAIEDLTTALSHGDSPFAADALMARGGAWSNAGNPARAIADFRSAARLAPTKAEPLQGLGVLLDRTGDLAGAADAYARALALADDGPTANSLGRVLMFAGRFAEARAAYTTALRIGTTPLAYVPVWIYLAQIRADAAAEAIARAEFATHADPHAPRVWTDSLADFMLGRIDAPALLRLADASAADKRVGARCEADYYIAEVELAHGRRDAAGPLLAEAVRLCPTDFYEAYAAKAEQGLQAKATGSN